MTGYSLELATAADIAWTAEQEKVLYQGNEVIPFETLCGWYSSNPSGFYMVKDDSGENVGSIDILPIKQQTLQKMVEGEIEENDIEPDDLYAPYQKDLVRSLYVESVIVLVSPTSLKRQAISSVILSVPQILDSVCNLDNLEDIYCIVATKAGRKLARHLGFVLLEKGEDRKDKHDLFRAIYSDFHFKVKRLHDYYSRRQPN